MVALLAAPACVASEQIEPEVTSAQCDDGRDNDGDGLWDCEDPSCRGARICAFPKATTDAAEPMEPGPTTGGTTAPDAGMPPPVKDAGPTEPDGPSDASLPVDASEPMDASPCKAPCLPTTASVKLRVLSATVDTVDGNFIPYDIPLFYPDKERSGTGPDPYVAILLNGEQVHTTSHVLDTTTPTWSEAGVRLDISSDDVLEFEVLEYDGPTVPARRMFICTPELPAELPLSDGVMISCEARSTQTVTALLEPVL